MSLVIAACNNPDILSVMVIVRLIIKLLCIIGPIAVIIMATIDIAKAVMAQDQSAVSRNVRRIPQKFIGLILIFLVPYILDFVIGIADSDYEYAACFENANSEYVDAAYINIADSLVVNAEQNLSRLIYDDAKLAVNKVKDQELKETFTARLKEVDKKIKEEEKRKEEEKKKEEEAKRKQSDDGGGVKSGSSSGSVSNTLNLPYYNQCDSRWKSVKFGSSSSTICSSGCGYSSLAMIASGLNNDGNINPKTVHAYIHPGISPNKGAIEDAALYNQNMLNKYDMNAQVLFYRGSGLSKDAKLTKIRDALKANKAIEVLIPGHYVVFTPATNGEVVLLDPGNGSNNGTYTLENLWNKFYNHKNRCNELGKCGFMYAVAYTAK